LKWSLVLIRQVFGCLLLPLYFLGTTCSAQTTLPESVQLKTAWRTGFPRAGLNNGETLVEWFKTRAKSLGQEGKWRLLIIGDSLSDGGYHWSHYFRRDLQAAYGNAGPGNIWAVHAGGAPGQGFAPSWLFSPDDFSSHKGAKGAWRNGWGGRGDIWPYLGWNGNFLARDSSEAQYFLEAQGSRFTVVYSSGTFTTFNGQPVENRAGGFTATFDGQSPPGAQTVKDRIAWYKANRYPYLDLQEGLDSAAMKRLGWFNDNIHLAQPGGQGIGEAIAKLFAP
jgi:hypothetical protein